MVEIPDPDERIEFAIRENSEAHRKDGEWLARLATIAAGGHILGRKMGRNLFADLADYAGRGIRFLGSSGRKTGQDAFTPETSDRLYGFLGVPRDAGGEVLRLGFGSGRAEDVGLIKDLGRAMAIQYDPGMHVDPKATARILARHFENLPRAESATPSFLHHDLQPLTVDLLLEHYNKGFFDDIAKNTFANKTTGGRTKPLSISIVEKAMDPELGWLTGREIVDANLFLSKDGSRIVDTRIIRPRYLLDSITDIVDIAGTGKAFASMFGSEGSVGLLGMAKKAGQGNRIFVGGDVYELAIQGPVLRASGKTMGRVGDMRHVPAMLRETKDLEDIYGKDTQKGLWNAVQNKIGVGPKFHEKRSFGIPFVGHFLRNLRGVGSGEAVLYANRFKTKGTSSAEVLFAEDLPELFLTPSGAEVVPGKYHGKGFIDPSDVSFMDRAKAYLSISKDISILKKEAVLKKTQSKSDLYGGFGRSGLGSLESRVGVSRTPTGVTQVGELDYNIRSQFYAADAGFTNKLYDFANYQTMRLNKLAGSTMFGMGFRPSGNLFANTLRLAAIPAAMYTALEGVRYTDYVLENLTGISPIDSAAGLYVKGRVLQQKTRELLGVAGVVRHVEKDMMPGLDVGFIGTLISTAIGLKALAVTGSFGKAAAAAGSIYAAIGGPNVGQPSQELAEEYGGERQVPIRKSRWWMLGYCLPPYEKVLLNNGEIKRADEVEEGDILINKDGLPVKVQTRLVRNVELDENLIEIRIIGDNQPRHLTEDHPVLVHRNPCPYDLYVSGCNPTRKDNSSCITLLERKKSKCTYNDDLKLEWILAKDLVPSDYVVLPRRSISHSGGDFDLGLLAGWYLAEGNVHNKGRSLEFTFNAHEEVFALSISDIIERKFSNSSTIKIDKNIGKMRSFGKKLYGFIEDLGILYKKNIHPANLLNQGEQFLRGFIRGAFFGDGTCDNGKWSFKSSKETIAYLVRDIAHMLGGSACVQYNISVVDGGEFYSYLVRINEPVPDLRLDKHYTAHVPCDLKTKNTAISCGDYILYPVKSATPIEYDGPVYDFEVSEGHSFCLPSFVVHNSPYKGGQIDHYAPSWYQRLVSDPHVKNIYGSEDNYWKYGSFLPTPSNLFYLRNVLDPYKIEKMNFFRRPYPVTGGMMEEFPIFGPMLSDTIGSVIKPRKRMHSEQMALLIANSNITTKGVPNDTAQRLGIPNVPASLMPLDRPDILADRLEKYANVALEPTGIWKFVMELFGVKFDEGRKLADAGAMTSMTRAFYDRQLSGMLGETELIRRFLLSDYGTASHMNQLVNPIPNAMPRWLPGTLSMFPEDRENFYDFNRGDPYIKIPGGEYRLPGPGYEAVNELHGKDTYDAVDQFLILSDVAPFSSAYYRAASKLNKMRLDEKWQSKVDRAMEQRDKRVQRYEFNMDGWDKSLTQANMNPVSRSVRRSWDFATQNVLREVPIIGSKFVHTRNPLEHYIKFQVEGEEFADWHKPYESIIRPGFYDIIGEDPVTAGLKGATVGAIMSSKVGSWLNPFRAMTLHSRESTIGFGIIGALGSAARMASTGDLEGGFVPPHVRTERDVEQYFDALKYKKYRQLQLMAQQRGDSGLASTLSSQVRKTNIFGLEHFKKTNDIEIYRSSLSRTERPYFEAFLKAPESLRSDVLKVTPHHMAEVLRGSYELTEAPEASPEGSYEAADLAIQDYFSRHVIPSPNWPGWHPGVPDNAVRIKMVEHGIGGVSDAIHRFGFFPSQQEETDIRFNYLDDYAPYKLTHGPFDILSATKQKLFGFLGLRRNSISTGPPIDTIRLSVYDDSVDDMYAFYGEVYR